MAKKPLSRELTSLHNKLWIYNVIICIISLVAAVCVVLMPIFDFRVHLKGESFSELMQPADESSESSDGDIAAELSTRLEKESFDIIINIKPLKMFQAAIGDDKDMEDFMNSLVGKEGAQKFMEDFANKLAPALIETVVSVTIDEMVGSALVVAGKEMTPTLKEQVKGYKEGTTQAVETLLGEASTPSDPEKAKAEFAAVVHNMVNEQQMLNGLDISEADLNKAFSDIIDSGTNPETGKFEIVYMLGNLDQMQGGEGGEGAEGDSSGMDDLQQIIDIIQNPGGVLVEALGDNMDMVKLAVLIAFCALIALPALLWLLLALCAGIRIFMKRKRVKTWYVKLCGVWHGLFVLLLNVIVWMAPLIMEWVSLDGAAFNIFTAASIKFMGSGMVTGVCWLALVILGWCGYNRTRKRIKKLTKAEKKAVKTGITPRQYFADKKKVIKKANKAGLTVDQYLDGKARDLKIDTDFVTVVEPEPKKEESAEEREDTVSEQAATTTETTAPVAITAEETQEPQETQADVSPEQTEEESVSAENATETAAENAESPAVAPIVEPIAEKADDTDDAENANNAEIAAAEATQETVVETPVAEEKTEEATPPAPKKTTTRKAPVKKAATPKTESVETVADEAKPAAKKAPAKKSTTPKSTTTTTTTTKTTATPRATTTTKTTTKTTTTPHSTTTTKTTTKTTKAATPKATAAKSTATKAATPKATATKSTATKAAAPKTTATKSTATKAATPKTTAAKSTAAKKPAAKKDE